MSACASVRVVSLCVGSGNDFDPKTKNHRRRSEWKRFEDCVPSADPKSRDLATSKFSKNET